MISSGSNGHWKSSIARVLLSFIVDTRGILDAQRAQCGCIELLSRFRTAAFAAGN